MAVKKFEQREPGFNEYTNHLGERVRIDPTLAHNILSLVEAAKSTYGDVWIIITGIEGSGKSTLQRQLGRLVDPTFDEKRIEFNPEGFVKAQFAGLPEDWVTKDYHEGKYASKPWTAICMDESAKLDRKRTMSSGSVEFTGFSTQNRQLHKINFVVLPNAHMLDGYIMEHRASALIDCYKHEGTEMGFYRWFTKKQIKKMFNSDMHRRKEYPSNPAFRGRFSGREAFDITEYNKKKADALNAYRKGVGKEAVVDPAKVIEAYENRVIKNVIEMGLEQKTVYKALGMSEPTWFSRKKRLIEYLNLKEPPKKGSAKRALLGIELPTHKQEAPESG